MKKTILQRKWQSKVHYWKKRQMWNQCVVFLSTRNKLFLCFYYVFFYLKMRREKTCNSYKNNNDKMRLYSFLLPFFPIPFTCFCVVFLNIDNILWVRLCIGMFIFALNLTYTFMIIIFVFLAFCFFNAQHINSQMLHKYTKKMP